MDADRFDALARSLTAAGSRRRALAAALGGAFGTALGAFSVDENAAAKKKCPPCKKRKKGKCKKRKPDGTPCPGGVCQSGRCCSPEPAAVTCAGACQTTRINRCGQAVTCDCPGGSNCLPNGTCARRCTGRAEDCAGCGASVFCTSPNTEGQQHCVVESRCSDHEVCFTSSSECPRGKQCQECGINEGKRCIPVATCTGG